jgi:tyrosine-protein kinase Etk/Wzc
MSVVLEPLPRLEEGAGADGQFIEALRFLLRLRRRVLTLWAICFVLSVVVTLLIPNSYMAVTRLMPPQQNQSLAAMLMGQAAGSPLLSMAQKDLGLKNPADIYVGVLMSRNIQDELIRRFDLGKVYRHSHTSQVREQLAEHTRIQLTKEGLLTVSVDDHDPRRAANLANAYAEELRIATRRLATTEAAQRRQFFDEQVQQTREELEQAESELRGVQQKTGVLEVDAQAKALIETSARLRSQIAEGEVESRGLRTFATARNPDLQRQEAELKGWRAQLARLESQQGGDTAFSKGKAPEQAQVYLHAAREVKYRETMLDMLLRQLEAAKLDEAKEGAIIQIVDVALPPDTKSSPPRLAIVIGSMLAVMLLTYCFAMFYPAVLSEMHSLRRKLRLDEAESWRQ